MSLAGIAGFAEGFGQAKQKKNDQARYDQWLQLQEAGLARLGAAQPQGQPIGGIDLSAGNSGGGGSYGVSQSGGAGSALNVPEELRAGILSTAQRLGMDPVDLATIISYETGGTFNPRQKGPRTQWGQHEGLIQFGEPQAREYGVNWDDPINSQLGEGGAIERYFKKAGYQPGMGLLDAYSAVNAGRVGLYDRSDANNGGAPGTVRDKVERQMSGHRAKAMALFGPKPAQQPPAAIPVLGAPRPPYRSAAR